MGQGRYMDGCGNCMKYSLFFVNLLIFLGSLAVIGLGIYILVDKSFGSQLLGTNLYSGAIYILIGAAVLVCIISCFGCFGAAKEVRCMLVTYFIIVFLIFVTMLVGGILLYVFRHKVETTMRNALETTLETYNTSQESRQGWDEVQSTLHCCGVNSYLDWKGTIPDTCCQPIRPGVFNRCSALSPTLYNIGCFQAWPDYMKHNAAIVGGVGIAVACVMILSMVFSCALFNLID